MYTTSLSNKPQIQSLFQGFRLVGGVSKNNNRTEAFVMGDKVSIEYLNDFVEEAEKLGADAIVCVRYASSSVMQSAAEVMAYGTAVKFKG